MNLCAACTHHLTYGIHDKDSRICCITITANALRKDYPDLFVAGVRFPPPEAAYKGWAGLVEACDFYKAKRPA